MLDHDGDIHALFDGAPSTTEFKKLRKRIVRQTREAIEAYGMIERGARSTATAIGVGSHHSIGLSWP